MLNGILNSIGGNLMENDTSSTIRVKFQHLIEVPADGLSFAVFIGSQPDVLCTLRFTFKLINYFFPIILIPMFVFPC